MTTMPIKPPFVSNERSRPMCLHACVQMVMKACHANRVYSFDEMDKIMRRKEGRWPTPFGLFSMLKEQGIEISFTSAFSLPRFAAEKEQYLLDFCGPEVGRIQIQNSDVANDSEHVRTLLRDQSAQITQRTPTISDIRDSLSNGWYAMPLINSLALKGEPGYRAHFVLAYACDEKTVTLHNPGWRPAPALTVTWDQLDRSWMFENKGSRALSCFRPSRKPDRGQPEDSLTA